MSPIFVSNFGESNGNWGTVWGQLGNTSIPTFSLLFGVLADHLHANVDRRGHIRASTCCDNRQTWTDGLTIPDIPKRSLSKCTSSLFLTGSFHSFSFR